MPRLADIHPGEEIPGKPVHLNHVPPRFHFVKQLSISLTCAADWSYGSATSTPLRNKEEMCKWKADT